MRIGKRGEFQAGIWIISIVIYFVIFFVTATAISNARAYYSQDIWANNDPGITAKGNVFEQGGYCGGSSDYGYLLGYGDVLPCSSLNIAKDEQGNALYDYQCNNVTGCFYENYTSLFSGTKYQCSGIVNLTAYSINTTDAESVCASSYLQVRGLCEQFTCQWIDVSNLGTGRPNIESGTTIWESFVWIVSFRYDFGIARYNWLLTLLFFYIPLIALLWAGYRSLPLVGFGG